jgi:hypothetical protein
MKTGCAKLSLVRKKKARVLQCVETAPFMEVAKKSCAPN